MGKWSSDMATWSQVIRVPEARSLLLLLAGTGHGGRAFAPCLVAMRDMLTGRLQQQSGESCGRLR